MENNILKCNVRAIKDAAKIKQLHLSSPVLCSTSAAEYSKLMLCMHMGKSPATKRRIRTISTVDGKNVMRGGVGQHITVVPVRSTTP